MIKNTFCILDGIGEKLERRLWREGTLTWEDFIGADALLGMTRERKGFFDECLLRNRDALNAGDASFFSNRLRRREHWRIFDFFRQDAVCLDIESNGYQPGSGGVVTVVGLYDGYDYTCLVRGDNLSGEALMKELSRYKCLITFYGASFDVPFLLRSFPGLRVNMPHFDLCFAAKRLGIKGGLKKLENELGIIRDESVQGLDGYDAVKLWEYAGRGSREALDTLVRYNREDTVNLMHIASVFYDRLRRSTGIEEYLSCGVA
ncbi:MAG: ribonuclease H-like domain-containing protein [Nitrospiraceae bacterium]|nr:ribonuclease H-like domain-containing protein [Nitrospiraceae bacterium]